LNLEHIVLDDSGWQRIHELLRAKSNSPISTNILEQLKYADAKSAIIEHEYIDRDFSEMYANFYSRTFKRYVKLCKRIFIFDCEFKEDFIDKTHPTELTFFLEKMGADHILSVMVVRPVAEAPINSVFSKPPPNDTRHRTNLLINSTVIHHLAGADIALAANHMTQQDSRVGSCAQAAIWSTARHFKNRHGGPWISTPEITELAISSADFDLSKSLPLGSDFLPVGKIVQSLQALGHEPYGYSKEVNAAQTAYEWLSVNPSEVISRYLDSGIPLILGITFPNEQIGHAVVATGRVRKSTQANVQNANRTFAEFYSHFLVNDDQMGPHLFTPIDKPDGSEPKGHQHIWKIGGKEHHINIREYLNYIIVPLPSKVFFPAEMAENISRALIDHYLKSYDIRVKELGVDNSAVIEQSEKFKKDYVDNEIVVRTYLTYGWKYKKRALRNNLSDPIKYIIQDLELPRYVWVTELGTHESLKSDNPYERRIFGHAVIDATAKNTNKESALLFHAPGYCMHHKHVNSDGTFKLQEDLLLPKVDAPYFPKKRGETNFKHFFADLKKNGV